MKGKALTPAETTALEKLKSQEPNLYRNLIGVVYQRIGGKRIERATSTALQVV